MTKHIKIFRLTMIITVAFIASLLPCQTAIAAETITIPGGSDQATEINITKVDGNGHTLPGAKFVIHECDKDGNYISGELAHWTSQNYPESYCGADDETDGGEKWPSVGHYYALTEVSPVSSEYSKVPGDIIFYFKGKEFGGEMVIVNGGSQTDEYVKDGVTYAKVNPGKGNSTSNDVTVTSWDVTVMNYKKDSEIDVTNTEHGKDTVNHVKRSKEGMAQTSDLFNPAMTAVIVLIGAVLVILGIKSRGKKKDEPDVETADAFETAAATADTVAETSEAATAPAEVATTDAGETAADATAAQPDDSKKSDD